MGEKKAPGEIFHKLKGIALVVGKIFSQCRLDLLFGCRGGNLNDYFICGIDQIDTRRIFLFSIKWIGARPEWH